MGEGAGSALVLCIDQRIHGCGTELAIHVWPCSFGFKLWIAEGGRRCSLNRDFWSNIQEVWQ